MDDIKVLKSNEQDFRIQNGINFYLTDGYGVIHFWKEETLLISHWIDDDNPGFYTERSSPLAFLLITGKSVREVWERGIATIIKAPWLEVYDRKYENRTK